MLRGVLAVVHRVIMNGRSVSGHSSPVLTTAKCDGGKHAVSMGFLPLGVMSPKEMQKRPANQALVAGLVAVVTISALLAGR